MFLFLSRKKDNANTKESYIKNIILIKNIIDMGLKPGPKRIAKSTGKPDRREGVDFLIGTNEIYLQSRTKR